MNALTTQLRGTFVYAGAPTQAPHRKRYAPVMEISMYEFPKRIKQHRNETKALAILLYHLRDFGIVRDIRESDYGIDLEYEFVARDQVVGRVIKIQLKSVSRINKKNPKIGNIKQSTLNYWAEISYRINTIVVGVNTINEEIYFTFPIFWDAISKIDNTRKTKSIEFAKNEGNCEAAAILIHHMALIPTINEILLTHKNILARVGEILEFCSTAIYHDEFLEFEEFADLKRFLDDASILLWRSNINEQFKDYDNSPSWYTLDFFRKNTKDGILKYWDMKDKLNIIAVELFKELIRLRNKVLNSFCYWCVKDRDYLELVYKNNFERIISEDIDGIIRKYSEIEYNFLEKDYNDFANKKIDEFEKNTA